MTKPRFFVPHHRLVEMNERPGSSGVMPKCACGWWTVTASFLGANHAMKRHLESVAASLLSDVELESVLGDDKDDEREFAN